MPVEGNFSILLPSTFEISVLSAIPADVTAEDLEILMEDMFPNEGGNQKNYYSKFILFTRSGFMVTRLGTCAGYSWEVEWEREGDKHDLLLHESSLVGSEVGISIDTQADGGTWLRPIRADMTRTPTSNSTEV